MAVIERFSATVNEEDDRCLEPLRGVYRHDADLVPVLVLLALDLRRFALERRNESLQTGKPGRLEGERKAQEFVENVADLAAEAGKIGPAAAMRAQHPGIEVVDRKALRQHPESQQTLDRSCEALGPVAGQRLEPNPEADTLRSVGGEIEEILLAMVEERALHQSSKREVVRGQQKEAAERQKVLHGNVRSQLQPVGAGHGNIVAALQRAGQRIDEAVALAHENQDVAGPDRATLALLDDSVPADHLFDGIGDASCQNGGGRAFRRGIEGRRPVLRLIRLFGRDHGPQIDRAGMADPARHVDDAVPAGAEPAGILGNREDLVDGRENGQRRAERQRQSDRAEGLAAGRHGP